MTTKRLTNLASYYILNGVFGVCTYYGFYESVEGAKNVSLFIGWLTSIFAVLMLLIFLVPEARKVFAKSLYEKDWQPSAPYIVDLAFDLFILGTFVWFDHYILSIFYVATIIASKSLRDVRKEFTFEMLIASRKND